LPWAPQVERTNQSSSTSRVAASSLSIASTSNIFISISLLQRILRLSCLR
jgi:hypothetical protein